MNKKINRIVTVLLLTAIGIMSIRLFITVIPLKAEKTDTDAGVSYIVAQEQKDAAKEENAIRKEEEKIRGTSQQQSKKKELKDGNFKAAFKDIVIAGDSIVKSINEYGILDSSQVIAEVGGGMRYLEQVSDDIIAANPKYLVLHFGENDVESPEKAAVFAKTYGERIAYLQEHLPHTKIYVDSIFPVEDFAIKNEPYLVHIDAYNQEIKKMAADRKVTYLDFTPLWKSYPKDYYDGDGIHPKASYYKEQYLPYIYAEVQE